MMKDERRKMKAIDQPIPSALMPAAGDSLATKPSLDGAFPVCPVSLPGFHLYCAMRQGPGDKTFRSISDAVDVGHFEIPDALPTNSAKIGVSQIGIHTTDVGEIGSRQVGARQVGIV